MANDPLRYARAAKRLGVIAVVCAIVGVALQTVTCVTRKAPACVDRQRITSACRGAAVQLTATLQALDTAPDVGLQLAAHDASWSQLCGGDGDALGVVAFRRDVAATRTALVALRERWLAVQ